LILTGRIRPGQNCTETKYTAYVDLDDDFPVIAVNDIFMYSTTQRGRLCYCRSRLSCRLVLLCLFFNILYWMECDVVVVVFFNFHLRK